MARYPLFGICRDGNGKAIASATVTIYPADSGTVAEIYADKSGGSIVTSGQVTSDSNGKWIAYVDDATYPLVTLFDITVSKTGYVSQSYPDVW